MRPTAYWSAERTWGEVALEVRSPPEVAGFASLVHYAGAGSELGEHRFSIRAEEIDAVIAGLTEVRRLLLGDRKHEVKALDPVLRGKR